MTDTEKAREWFVEQGCLNDFVSVEKAVEYAQHHTKQVLDELIEWMEEDPRKHHSSAFRDAITKAKELLG